MSATLERIELYLDGVETGSGVYRDRVLSNYAEALKDLDWNHRERLRWRELFYQACREVENEDARHALQSLAGVAWS